MHLASCLPGNHSELPDTCIINARDDEARHSRAHARGLSVPAKKKQENELCETQDCEWEEEKRSDKR